MAADIHVALTNAVRITPFHGLARYKMRLLRNQAAVFLCFFFAVFLQTATSSGAEESGKNGPFFLRLPAFTVNLLGPERQYLQLDIKLSLANPQAEGKIKAYLPVIQNRMILLLTSKDATGLKTLDGKLGLVREIRDAVNNEMGFTEKDGVTDVLFDAFIIQ